MGVYMLVCVVPMCWSLTHAALHFVSARAHCMSRLNRLASILSLLQDLTILLRNDDSSCDGRFLLSHPACCAQGICSRVTPPVRLHYKGSKFHRIVAGQCVQGGDIMCGNGKGNLSAFAGESLPPSVPHT